MEVSVLQIRVPVVIAFRSLSAPLVGEILAGWIANRRPLSSVDGVQLLLDPTTISGTQLVVVGEFSQSSLFARPPDIRCPLCGNESRWQARGDRAGVIERDVPSVVCGYVWGIARHRPHIFQARVVVGLCTQALAAQTDLQRA